jgi:HEPN domain.
MSALEEAKAHLEKAVEFLEAAHVRNDLELYSAATSNAVIAGINSKDAICLKLTGRTAKTENHQEALAELRTTGVKGRDLEPTLARLLKLKAKSQYQCAPVAATDASKAVEWAGRMVDVATEVVVS